ncbi:hypothetical protein AWZ03_011987 [Drosophila navojoa]|uniref:Uncharacterized protein n=1 Tax=Drosophila navojoa TaxID=7232 RepID=A0A484AYT9_DRONA|nr:hypothetical protein AWZ03_011987 [Drosophila navojoa]
MPDYKLVTAVPVVVLDDEQKLVSTAADTNSDAGSSISTGSATSLASTTRNDRRITEKALNLKGGRGKEKG